MSSLKFKERARCDSNCNHDVLFAECLGGKLSADSTKRFQRTAHIDSLEDDASSSDEVDDDGRVYKNPRNLPSALCPRDEEQAALLVRTVSEYTTRDLCYYILCFQA